MLGGWIFPPAHKRKYKHEKVDSTNSPPDEIPELRTILKDKDQSLSAKASARARIKKVGPDSSKHVQKIARALLHGNVKDSGAALSILKALVRIGSEAMPGSPVSYDVNEATPHLIEALESADSDLQDHIVWALQMITGEEYGKDKDRWCQWWSEYNAGNRSR